MGVRIGAGQHLCDEVCGEGRDMTDNPFLFDGRDISELKEEKRDRLTYALFVDMVRGQRTARSEVCQVQSDSNYENRIVYHLCEFSREKQSDGKCLWLTDQL